MITVLMILFFYVIIGLPIGFMITCAEYKDFKSEERILGNLITGIFFWPFALAYLAEAGYFRIQLRWAFLENIIKKVCS